MIRFSLSEFEHCEQMLIFLRLMMFVLGLLAAVPGNAQGGPVRDASAIAVLQNSISSMGGVSSWQGVQDWTMSGATSVNGSSQPPSNFKWIGAGTEFRMETDAASTTSVFFSGHGSPARMFNGDVSGLNYFVARANSPLYLPGIGILQELSNQQLTIQYVGGVVIHGVAAVQIHVSDDSDHVGSLVTPHEWYFDATTFVPLEVQLRLPPNENASDYLNGTLDFWQFQSVDGLSVPSQITLSRANGPTKSISVNSVTFDSGVPQSMFDPPPGGGQ